MCSTYTCVKYLDDYDIDILYMYNCCNTVQTGTADKDHGGMCEQTKACMRDFITLFRVTSVCLLNMSVSPSQNADLAGVTSKQF